ncbi:hypothetical protein BJ165DRAFT_1518169 [Panaeolus papilionaceus]|nr:hypothetical protein BJ165DRAFT_1518169 [Panaeolus papilionaceus]
MNTKASALEILDRPLHKKCAFDDIGFTATPHLYQDLHNRIEEAVREKQAIELKLSQPEAKTDLNLKSILDKNLLENEQKRNKFIAQFIEYGDPLAQFADDHQRLCELVLSLRPELLDRLSPRRSELRKTDLVRQDTDQIIDRHPPNTTGIHRVLGAAQDRFKSLRGFKR